MAGYQYSDIIFEIKGKIGIIKLNRPKSLNSFGGRLIVDVIHALRILDAHHHTVFTVITGAGRFFSSGADVNWATAEAGQPEPMCNSEAVKKLDILHRLSANVQLNASMINHRKVLVVAMNSPAVGGGAAWFQGVADIVVASSTSWLHCPFSALGLVPEFGSATTFQQSIGVHRANDVLMLGRKVTAAELLEWGLVNRLFEPQHFHEQVLEFLEQQLKINDGVSMLQHKRLMDSPLRAGRLVALYEATDAVAERFVEGAPASRFADISRRLRGQLQCVE